MDGTILVIGKKACFIYNSESDVIRLLNGGAVSENILCDLNYYGKDLPIMIESSKIKIADLLNLQIDKLDYSEKSLKYVDEAIMVYFCRRKG